MPRFAPALSALVILSLGGAARETGAQVVSLPTVRRGGDPVHALLRDIVRAHRVPRYAAPDSCGVNTPTSGAAKDSARFQRVLDRIVLAPLSAKRLDELRSEVESAYSARRRAEYQDRHVHVDTAIRRLRAEIGRQRNQATTERAAFNTATTLDSSRARADSITNASRDTLTRAEAELNQVALRFESLGAAVETRSVSDLRLLDSLFRAVTEIGERLDARKRPWLLLLPIRGIGRTVPRFQPSAADDRYWSSGDEETVAMQGLIDCLVRPTRAGAVATPGSGEIVPEEVVTEREVVTLIEAARERNVSPAPALLDSLQRVARAVVIQRKLDSRIFFPVASRDQALAFWQQRAVSALNVAAISGTRDQAAAFTEIASAVLHPLRLSVNAVVATESDEEEDPDPTPPAAQPDPDAANRLLTGGGGLNVAIAYPVAHVGRRDGFIDVTLLAAPRASITVPALTPADGGNDGLFDGGGELHIRTVDLTDGVGLFLQGRHSYVAGGGDFYGKLGLPEKDGDFTYTTVAAGLLFGSRYLVTWSKAVSGPRSVLDVGPQVSVTILRASELPPR